MTAVVLCGSLGSTAAMWEPQLPALAAAGYDSFRVDHPGHGREPAPAGLVTVADLAARVLRLLDERGLERASFCGLSLGGCVGMRLAAYAPERVERRVVACASPRFGTRESWLDRAATVREQGLEAIADAVLARWFTRGFSDTERYRAMLLSTSREGYARCCEALAEFDARPWLDRIEAPTLVVHGAADPAVGEADLDLLIRGIGDSRLVVLDDAAHLANVEQAEAFSAAVLEFLA